MSSRVRSWVEAIGAITLIAGLALVAVQIKQSNDITKIQLRTSVYHQWRAVDATRQGEEFAAVLAKSIENPQEITLAEFIELDAYYLGVLDQLNSIAHHDETGFRTESLETTVTNNAQIYFGNDFARAWLKRHWSRPSQTQRQWARLLLAALDDIDPGAFEAKYRGVLDDLE